MKPKKAKCMIPRIIKNPKSFARWLKQYLRRTREIESQIGGELHSC